MIRSLLELRSGDLVRGAKRSNGLANIDEMSCDTSGKNRISTALALWHTLYIVANSVSEIGASVLVPDLITGVVEAEGSGWKVGNYIVVVGHSLVAVRSK